MLVNLLVPPSIVIIFNPSAVASVDFIAAARSIVSFAGDKLTLVTLEVIFEATSSLAPTVPLK